METRLKCAKCRMDLTVDKFKLKRDDKYQKNCLVCNAKAREYSLNRKCPHGRLKAQCRDCGGSAICEHDRLRAQCKECGGSAICEHNKLRSSCKRCTDPLLVTIRTMVNGSRSKDKKGERFDRVNFIDYCFVEALLEEFTHCYYESCNVKLQIIEYQDDLATIERLDNNIGHTRANCVIACRKCNLSRVGDRTPQPDINSDQVDIDTRASVVEVTVCDATVRGGPVVEDLADVSD